MTPLVKPTFRRNVEKMGYALEKHCYNTHDGYINTVFRIPSESGLPNTVGKPKDQIVPKPVVICQHGILDNCHGFLSAEDRSIAI